MTTFWLDCRKFDPCELLKFWPTCAMSWEQRMNAISLLAFYIFVMLSIIYKQPKFLFALLLVLMVIAIIYYTCKPKKQKESFNSCSPCNQVLSEDLDLETKPKSGMKKLDEFTDLTPIMDHKRSVHKLKQTPTHMSDGVSPLQNNYRALDNTNSRFLDFKNRDPFKVKNDQSSFFRSLWHQTGPKCHESGITRLQPYMPFDSADCQGRSAGR